MQKKKKGLNKNSKPSPAGRAVVEGLKEAIAHVRGDITLPTHEYPPRVDVKAIRAKSGLSQSQFADRYGFNARTWHDWEVGRVQPPNAVRAYFIVIDRFPETVERALKGAA